MSAFGIAYGSVVCLPCFELSVVLQRVEDSSESAALTWSSYVELSY